MLKHKRCKGLRLNLDFFFLNWAFNPLMYLRTKSEPIKNPEDKDFTLKILALY